MTTQADIDEAVEYFNARFEEPFSPYKGSVYGQRLLTLIRACLQPAQSAWLPYKDYHEDHGFVLWHLLPVCEPPYVGSELSSDWPRHYVGDENNLRWTRLPAPPTEGEE
jgi:hypothetical protein